MSRFSALLSSSTWVRPAVWGVFVAALFALAVSASAEMVFHVASAGNDANPGTRRKPFATLERARQAVRLAGPGKARRVIVHGGIGDLAGALDI